MFEPAADKPTIVCPPLNGEPTRVSGCNPGSLAPGSAHLRSRRFNYCRAAQVLMALPRLGRAACWRLSPACHLEDKLMKRELRLVPLYLRSAGNLSSKNVKVILAPMLQLLLSVNRQTDR